MGTGQPHRHFQQYAPTDSMREGDSADCHKKLVHVQMVEEKHDQGNLKKRRD